MKYYPFTALVGQDRLKTAYLANIVNPAIGGLLISGVKGTGKSTLVRSIEDVLPDYQAVKNCPFNCDPEAPEAFCSFCQKNEDREIVTRQMKVVNLPLSVSEDRLIGSIQVEKLLSSGKKEIQVGILGQANRNILYIDEVNLLPDHIVDDILDAAASHWNSIERESFSIEHPSEFVLVGTMNPEEGDLRPQILDRFPIGVTIKSIVDPVDRVEIVRRNLMFENNPIKFRDLFTSQSSQLREIIIKSRELLPEVLINEDHILAVASACAELKVDGQRPDIVIFKVARATAALESRKKTESKDIVLAAILTLCHRTRDGGLLGPPTEEDVQEIFVKHLKGVKVKDDGYFAPATSMDHFGQSMIAEAGGDSSGSWSDDQKKNMK